MFCEEKVEKRPSPPLFRSDLLGLMRGGGRGRGRSSIGLLRLRRRGLRQREREREC